MLQPLAFAMSLVALVVFSLLALLDVHPYLALIGLVLFPTLALLNRIYTSRVEPPATRAQAALGGSPASPTRASTA